MHIALHQKQIQTVSYIVANRIAVIHNGSDPNQWNFVTG